MAWGPSQEFPERSSLGGFRQRFGDHDQLLGMTGININLV